MRKHVVIGVSVIILSFISIFFLSTFTGGTGGGTVNDPLVTRGDVNGLIDEVKLDEEAIYAYINEKLSNIPVDGDGVPVAIGFEVVEVEEGEVLYGEEGTEMILRAGMAKIIANDAGDGLTDITEGIDLKDQTMVEKNHLLIVPRSDNRGLTFDSKCYVMVKGSYRVE